LIVAICLDSAEQRASSAKRFALLACHAALRVNDLVHIPAVAINRPCVVFYSMQIF